MEPGFLECVSVRTLLDVDSPIGTVRCCDGVDERKL